MKNVILTAVIVILVASSSILGYLYADTSNELSTTKLQLNAANIQVTSLQAELATANAQVTSLQAQLVTANTQVTSLQAELATANAQVTSLQAQLATANAQVTSLQAQLDSAQPARHFNTKSELTSWLNSLPSSLKNFNSLTNALERQNQAAEDGYIYSVYVSGSHYGEEAIAGNTLYWIDSDGSLVALLTIS
jgi:chromosome segregation ATPase